MILTFDIDHLTLKKLSKKLETYFFEVLIQNWSRKIMSPTINMNFPRKLHKLPDYIERKQDTSQPRDFVTIATHLLIIMATAHLNL